MALPQSVVSELFKAFRTGDGVDLIRESVRLVMQLIEPTQAVPQAGPGAVYRDDRRQAWWRACRRPAGQRLAATHTIPSAAAAPRTCQRDFPVGTEQTGTLAPMPLAHPGGRGDASPPHPRLTFVTWSVSTGTFRSRRPYRG